MHVQIKIVSLQTKFYVMKEKKIPHYLIEKNNLVVQVTISILFAIAFLAIYIPLSDTQTAWFSVENENTLIYTLVFFILSIIFLIISRILMYYTSKSLVKFSVMKFVSWCLTEIVIIGLFHAFLSIRIMNINGFSPMFIVGKSILITFIALGFPFIVTDLSFALIDARRVLKIAKRVIKANSSNKSGNTNVKNNELKEETTQKNSDIVNLTDYAGAVKFTVKIENIYFIKAEGNYVKVFYNNKGDISSFVLRNTIQSIEDSLIGTSLMRCHRTYIVNINKIKVIRTEEDSCFIDFDHKELETVPISKTYNEKIVKRFAEM